MEECLMDILGRVKLLLADQSGIGIVSGSRWNVLRTLNARGRVKSQAISLRPAKVRYPLEIRMQTSSDPDVFDDIFHRREFKFLERIRNARVIIDLGANVGYVSAFCLSEYKHSFVLSVEPDPANHLQCSKNLRRYGDRSRLLCAAVWHTKGDLLLSRGTFGDGREWATEVRELTIEVTRNSSIGKPSASSMAGSTISANDFVPYSRSVTSAASTIPGTSAGRIPATGTQSFIPPASGAETISSSVSLCSRKNCAVASFGIVPTPAMACTLPSFVRTRMGASPPSPKCENSTTAAASIVATPASTAFPPCVYMRMPASVAYSVPPATAPRVPRAARRTGRSRRCGCCPRTTAARTVSETASLNFIWFPLYWIGPRPRAHSA